MAVSVLPEDFFSGLIPSRIVELDGTGVFQAVLAGFQDRNEDIRAYISIISKLFDPNAGYPISGTCVSVTYTDSFGLEITRNVLAYEMQSDQNYLDFEAGLLTDTEAKEWMAGVLNIGVDYISSVETVVDPFKTINEPMVGYLGKSIGTTFPTSDPNDPRNAALVESHFTRLPIKGSAKSIEIAGLLAGFDAVHVNPLWGRLSPRKPNDIGSGDNNLDFSETTSVEPTVEATDFYDPLEYRDGPFYTWSTSLGLLNSKNFLSLANNANPYVKLLVNGSIYTNFRGVFNTASTYGRGDIVVSLAGKTYVALTTTSTAPLDTIIEESSVMPAVDSTVDVTVRDSSWITVGASVTVSDGGAFKVSAKVDDTVTLLNEGANGNVDAGDPIYMGSVVMGESAAWLLIARPASGTYTMSGGTYNVEATTALSTTLSAIALSEGEGFNGLELIIEEANEDITSITTSSTEPTEVTVTTLVPHGLTTDTYVFISNVSPIDYVGLWRVVVVDDTTFTYTLSSNVYEAGTALSGSYATYYTGDFDITIFDRLSDIKYRTSYYNLSLAIKESTIEDGAVPVKTNPYIVQGVQNGSISATPPYLPFTTSGEVSGSVNQVNTTWLANLAAQAESTLNSAKPATRSIRSLNVGVLYEDETGYADYVDEYVLFDNSSPTSGTIQGPYGPRYANVRVLRLQSGSYFYRVLSSGSDSPTLTIGSDLVVTFPAVIGNTYTIQSTASLFPVQWLPAAPPITATKATVTYQLEMYEDLELSGEARTIDADSIYYSGTTSYGVIDLTLDLGSGVFSGNRPVAFPTNGCVVVNWVLEDTGTIRSEPLWIQKHVGTIAQLPRPEDEFDLDLYGATPQQYPDAYVWTRPLERETLDKDLERTYGEVETFPGEFVTTVESQSGVIYAVSAIQGQFPYRLKFNELGAQRSRPALAYSGSSLYYVGLRYGQLLVCPDSVLSNEILTGLSAWVPLNAHAEDNLWIENVFPVAQRLTVSGLQPEDRVWDSGRGWVTHMRGAEATLDTTPFLDEFTITFWLDVIASTASTTILEFGPVELKITTISTIDLYYDGVYKGTAAVSGFSFISIRQKNATILIGVDTIEADYTVTPVTTPFSDVVLSSTQGVCEYKIQDLKLWDTIRTSDTLAKVYSPSRVATIVATQAPHIEVSTTGDRWFLNALSSGFVTLGLQPATTFIEVTDQYNGTTGGTTTSVDVGTTSMGPGYLLDVANYSAAGRFIADSRRNLVGLPGGSLPSLPRQLGEALRPTSAVNKDIVSPDSGIPSGINPLWLADTSAGNVRTISPPYAPDGGVESTEATGVSTPWPNLANDTNPVVDRVWIEADNADTYQVTVAGSYASPVLTAETIKNTSDGVVTEWPAGATTTITDGSNKVSIALNSAGSGTLYITAIADTTTPRTYLYRHSYSLFDYTGNDGLIVTESTVIQAGSPSLSTPGQLVWTFDGALTAGHYRLKFTVHNVGKVASTFAGFDVEVTVGQNITFPLTLSTTGDSEDTYYDFHVETTQVAPFLVQVSWSGLLNDPTRGISYHMVVSNVVVSQLATQVFKVDNVLGSLSLTEMDTTAPSSTALSSLDPGGWLATITSSGTISSWEHEANIRTTVDGVEDSATLAELITFSTGDKVSALMVDPGYAGATVLQDATIPAAPVIASHTQVVTPATSPIQVGYSVTLAVVVDRAVAFIWYFWDGSTETTYEPTVTKTINEGGTISWTCKAADEWGQFDSVTDSMSVNAPPVIQSAELTFNDLAPTYATELNTTISDPDSASPITVWLDGITPTTISTTSHGTTEGTATFAFNVSTSSTKVLHAVDANGGTTLIDIGIRATPAKPILAAITAIPRKPRIGTPSALSFVCRMTNPNGGSVPTFEWEFSSSDWVLSDFSSAPGFTVGVSTATTPGAVQSLGGNIYQNSILVPVLVSQTRGQKRVKLTITPPSGAGDEVELYGQVTLYENHDPEVVRFNIVSPELIIAGEAVTIECEATDPDDDILAYEWNLTGCSDPVQVGLTTNPVTVYPITTVVYGSMTVSDPYGGYDTARIPPVIISSSTIVDGYVGFDLEYTPRAMSESAGTFTFGQLPSGLALLDGVVIGTPLIAGTTDTTLTCVSSTGTDSRPFLWRIFPAVDAPLSPTNLIVNGDGNNPRYQASQDLIIQWTVTSDGGVVPSSIVELRKFNGSLMKTVAVSQGVNVYKLTSNTILETFGSYQDISVRVFALRNGVRSIFPAETIVTYAY
jgi:hypothetical protein